MKKGICLGCIPRTDLKEAFELAKEAGFDGVEIGIGETGSITFDTTEEEALAIKKLADEVGIEFYSLFGGAGWTCPITSDDPEIREKAKRGIAKQLEVAAWLGCDTILVVPGYVGVQFNPAAPVVQYDIAYNRALEAIKELAPIAEEKKVNIGIENVWNYFLLSPLEMKEFIEKVNSPYVGAYFDIGNIRAYGYPEHWIRILGDKIKKMHIKDYSRAHNDFVELMTGDVNFKEVMAACKEIGYDGWITAEVRGYAQYPDEMLYSISRKMSKIFEG